MATQTLVKTPEKLKVIVLGGGMVGGTIARDLSALYAVTVADFDEKLREGFAKDGIAFARLDFSDLAAVAACVRPFDFVVGAIPGFLGFDAIKTCLEEKKSCADISFFPEDAMLLDKIAKENGVTCIVDCGVAPGIFNLLTGKALKEYDVLDLAGLYIGGIPQTPAGEWKYQSVFSPVDVIEEYIREPRFKIDGEAVTLKPLSGREIIRIAGIELETFNTDGVRTMLALPIGTCFEKTLRWPGHLDKIAEMYEAGLLTGEKREESLKQLFEEWKWNDGDKDMIVMKLEFKGKQGDKTVHETYEMVDLLDEKTGYTAMARTTGFTCCAALHMLASGGFREPGVFPPERLGEIDFATGFILSYIRARNVNIVHTKTEE